MSVELKAIETNLRRIERYLAHAEKLQNQGMALMFIKRPYGPRLSAAKLTSIQAKVYEKLADIGVQHSHIRKFLSEIVRK